MLISAKWRDGLAALARLAFLRFAGVGGGAPTLTLPRFAGEGTAAALPNKCWFPPPPSGGGVGGQD